MNEFWRGVFRFGFPPAGRHLRHARWVALVAGRFAQGWAGWLVGFGWPPHLSGTVWWLFGVGTVLTLLATLPESGTLP
jgi:hypothetical protein